MKPNNFPQRRSINGSLELYTQTNGISEKFTLEQAKQFTNAIEVTYEELYNLYSGSTLIAGSHYIITDFRTCYDMPDFDVYGKPSVGDETYVDSSTFKPNEDIKNPDGGLIDDTKTRATLDGDIANPDITGTPVEASRYQPIIVMATSESTLAPDAYQPLYPNDKIQYDITFNTTEATGEKAFGRITERIDEYGNRTDYDHRNIYFKRYTLYSYNERTLAKGTISIQSDGIVSGDTTDFTSFQVGQIIAVPSTEEVFFTITSISGDSLMTISGKNIPEISMVEFYTAISNGYVSYKPSNATDSPQYFTTFGQVQKANIDTPIYSGGDTAAAIGESALDPKVPIGGGDIAQPISQTVTAYNNYIGNYSNTVLIESNSNPINGGGIPIGGGGIPIGGGATPIYGDGMTIDGDGMTIDGGAISVDGDKTDVKIINFLLANNVFLGGANDAFLGGANAALLGGTYYNNVFGNNCHNNTFSSGATNNTVENYFYNNSIAIEFSNNKIGNNFHDNMLFLELLNTVRVASFYDNTIGNNFAYNITLGAFYNNTISNNFRENYNIESRFNSNEITADIQNINFSYNNYEVEVLPFYESYTCQFNISSSGNIVIIYFDDTNTPQFFIIEPIAEA
jgi:hypothetical protein